MTKKQAKKITIKVWTYLAEHPEIDLKSKLPDALYRLIGDLTCECPLCEILICEKCPLRRENELQFNCYNYLQWAYAGRKDVRRKCALRIVEKVKKWKV